jgi:enoyl-CoA hydratase/carnithine racemase
VCSGYINRILYSSVLPTVRALRKGWGIVSENASEVVVEKKGHVGLIRLNRPERLNALNSDIFDALNQAWTDFGADPSVRSIVFTGTGRGFCSGADMVGRAQGEAQGRRRSTGGNKMPQFTARQVKLYKPVITAVNGVCAGAGLHFVVDCDICIAAESATFTDTHANVGQITALEPIGLSRKIPLGAVLRMVVLGRNERLTAQRAYEIGMVSEVVSDDKLMERAMELGELAASVSPATVQKSLRVIWESLNQGIDDALDTGWEVVQGHWGHPDSSEGPRAFAEKRTPDWVDA